MIRRRALALLGLLALLATAFVTTGAGVASAAAGPPPPKRPHPILGPAPGLRYLTVKTIPPVAGATFTFEGQPIKTGSDGVATVTITQEQRDRIAVNRNDALVITSPTVNVSKQVRANFSGWYGNGSYKSGVETQTATFSFEYLTSFGFVNTKGDPVEPSLLQSMQLKSSVGATIDLGSPDPVWLEGRRVTPGSGGVDVRDISYRINEVKVAGSNVVNSAQQQFFPATARSATVTVKLLFFSVRFVATDGLFGGGVGKRIQLEYPDGKIRTFALGPKHSVTVDDLPRGDYHVTVVGGGLRMARPLSVSRNQEADLDVITYLDVGLVVLVLAIVAASVLWFGIVMRRRHRGAGRRVARGHQSAPPDASQPGDALPPLPLATPTNGNGAPTAPEHRDGDDLEFLTTAVGRDESARASVDRDVVAAAFSDADRREDGAVEPSEDTTEEAVHAPDEVSANEHFLVDGPGRRRR